MSSSIIKRAPNPSLTHFQKARWHHCGEHSSDGNIRIVLIMILYRACASRSCFIKMQNVFLENRYHDPGIIKRGCGQRPPNPICTQGYYLFVSEFILRNGYLLRHDGRRYSRTLFNAGHAGSQPLESLNLKAPSARHAVYLCHP